MFNRDAQQAESWMSVKENFFETYDIAAQEDTGSKKRENLDKAFALQVFSRLSTCIKIKSFLTNPMITMMYVGRKNKCS